MKMLFTGRDLVAAANKNNRAASIAADLQDYWGYIPETEIVDIIKLCEPATVLFEFYNDEDSLMESIHDVADYLMYEEYRYKPYLRVAVNDDVLSVLDSYFNPSDES